jgi:class 3 adenylate cyclase
MITAGSCAQQIAEADGVEVSTEGDSFFAVFTSASNALAAAVAASEHGLTQSRCESVSGLHTGEGKLGGDNGAAATAALRTTVHGALRG